MNKKVFLFFAIFITVICLGGCDFFGKTTTVSTLPTSVETTLSSSSQTTVSSLQPTTVTTLQPTTIPATISQTTATTEIPLRTISFDENGGSIVADITEQVGEIITSPQNPTKTGYTFAGWYSDSEFTSAYNFSTMPENNITVYAKWNVNQYTLEFVDFDGTVLQSETYDFGTSLLDVQIPSDPEREGYTFTGWNLSLPTVMDSFNLTIMAEYTINQYTLEYVDFDGTVLQSETYDFGSSLLEVQQPNVPARVGYTFTRWNLTLPSVMGSFDLTVMAEYTINQYILSFDTNEGNELDSISHEYLFQLESLDSPYREGYSFEGWYSDSALSIPLTLPINFVSDMTIYAKWEFVYNPSDYTFALLDDGTYEITGYSGSLSEITLPSSHQGQIVTRVSDWAFASNSDLTSVTIPSSITEIGSFAFNGCSNLEEVSLPDELETILDRAFFLCEKLMIVKIPINVTFIGAYSFAHCYSASIFAEASSKPIGWDDAWYLEYQAVAWGCDFTDETIIAFRTNGGGNITAIAQEIGSAIVFPEEPSREGFIFSGWYIDHLLTVAYTELIMPSSDIVLYALWEVDTSVSEPNDFTYDLQIDGTYEVTGYIGTSTIIVIPSSYLQTPVTSIADNAFMFSEVTKIIILASISNISQNAFYLADALTCIEVDSENTTYVSIDGVLFDHSINTLIWYPASKENASYTIPDSVTTIGFRAFLNTVNLEEVVIPDSVTHIGSAAFSGSQRLTEINLSRYVVNMGQCVFQNGTSLKSINVDVLNEVYSSINGVLFSKDQTLLIEYPSGSENTEYVIPRSVTEVGAYAFNGATILNTITITNQVVQIGVASFQGTSGLTMIIFEEGCLLTTIPAGAFSYATGLVDVVLPSGITSIESSAFGSTFSLESIFIPNTVTSIGYGAFWGSNKLIDVTFEAGSTLSSIGDYAFAGNSGLIRFDLPDSLMNIGEYAFIDVVNVRFYTIQPSKPTGWDPNWNPNNRPVVWGYLPGVEKTVTFETNGGCTIASITLEIGTDIVWPQDCLRAGYIFAGWYLDAGLTIENTITYMLSSDFTVYAKWNAIEGEDDPSNYLFVELIDHTYQITGYLGSDTHLVLPSAYMGQFVSSISSNAFMDDTTLISVVIHSGILSVGDQAFKGCSNLVIYSESESQPIDWNENWNPDGLPVVWGYNRIEEENHFMLTVVFSLEGSVPMVFHLENGSTLPFAEINQYTGSIATLVFWNQYLFYEDSQKTIKFTDHPIYENMILYADVFQNTLSVEAGLKDYYVTGNFAGWLDVLHPDSEYQMEIISATDERLGALSSELESADVIAIQSITLSSDLAEWASNFTISGVDVVYNGNLSVKVIQTLKDDYTITDFWAQSYESGAVVNLTPDTLFMPRYTDYNVIGDGTWNDNPFAKEAGSYWLVFAEIDRTYYMGLILK